VTFEGDHDLLQCVNHFFAIKSIQSRQSFRENLASALPKPVNYVSPLRSQFDYHRPAVSVSRPSFDQMLTNQTIRKLSHCRSRYSKRRRKPRRGQRLPSKQGQRLGLHYGQVHFNHVRPVMIEHQAE
jgi:hypothetical protein